MSVLQDYAAQLASAYGVKPTNIFAKILTSNDDSGRHGVLIPTESYSFFPDLPIADPKENSTVLFQGMDASSGQEKSFGWKYYQRYPERRVTRLSSILNETHLGRRLVIFVKASSVGRNDIYLCDARLEERDEDFASLLKSLFDDAPTEPGAFVQLPLHSPTFERDAALSELLDHYDEIHSRGWIDTLRSGDTGIGYTFETLAGIEENNDQNADYKGIEIKCKLKKDARSSAGKINLFQMAPAWSHKAKGIDRLRKIGIADSAGAYSCYSQVTPIANNLGLRLLVQPPLGDIDLHWHQDKLGGWSREKLEQRLAMKHSRAAFIKAESRPHNGRVQYRYNEFVYCEQPDIGRFIDMVGKRRIVFEFAMTERPLGSVRNHGYPWRLVDQRELDLLFAFQIRLRG